MQLTQAVVDELVAHAREDAPNECCGMIGARDGVATSVRRAENAKASPVAYDIDGLEQMRLSDEMDEAGEELGAIYHSHTRSEAYPSQTDINLAIGPEILYVIVGLTQDPPEVRGFHIVENQVREVGLEVV